MNKLLESYLKKAKDAQINIGTKKSADWFRRIAEKSANIRKLSRVTDGLKPAKLEAGEMITYTYDPKMKESLNYYDVHPLVIFLESTASGWYGLNLHYLPPTMRARVLYEAQYSKNSLFKIANALSKDARTKACFKRYISSYVASKPYSIPKESWEVAIALPFDRFLKEDKKTVWRDSKKINKKRR